MITCHLRYVLDPTKLAEFEHSISDLEYNWYLHTV